ncbi:MAG: nicotinate mononucleotide-dependent phosphoribosyltransferase CobT [Cyanophyceae cyanobacterium]
MIKVYTQLDQGQKWLQQHRHRVPSFACVLGFTDTGLIPGISAAGATPESRRYTAIADAEFLINGPQPQPQYPLPPLTVGASPVIISRAVVEALSLPVYLFNAGLPVAPAVPAIALQGVPARCASSGRALPLAAVKHLLQEGLRWGENLAATAGYVLLGECVVGGTTTALGILSGLGIDAGGKVNSSHPCCNHQQKQTIIQAGLKRLVAEPINPLELVAAVGDPMQIVVAGMAISASRSAGVLLAGGTQMLAIYALIQAIAKSLNLAVKLEHIVVGTTRWVAEDPTGDTVALAEAVGSVLLATELRLAASRFPSLQDYERGYVKEGVGAGGCAIAACLYRGWSQEQLLAAIDAVAERYYDLGVNSTVK